MKFPYFLLFLCPVVFQSCIGDDIIQDRVEPTIRIVNPLDSIAINAMYQFEYRFLNNVGQEENVVANWTSSNPTVISITNDGLATALQLGVADLSVAYSDAMSTYSDLITLHVGMATVTSDTNIRSGTINTTSNYVLTGDFTLEKEDGGELFLRFTDNYEASSALPGLYVYLTNNPNTTEEALEIGPVTTFSGAHEYNLGTSVDLFEYSHVLYFCKPFNVKVGDGAIN